MNMSNVSKLTNYLICILQVHALLDGYGLANHLDAAPEIPPGTLTTGDAITKNPEYVH